MLGAGERDMNPGPLEIERHAKRSMTARAGFGTRLVVAAATALLCGDLAYAQVDVEKRQTLTFQVGAPISREDKERLDPLGYFWFNRNDFPSKGTALRVIFAGPYLDAELSRFLPAHPKTALGAGLGGGAYVDRITPYSRGLPISSQEFDVDSAEARIFADREVTQVKLGDEGALPLDVRLTLGFAREFHRSTGRTKEFVLPAEFSTRYVMGELRLGGIEPGLGARQGLEVYASIDADFRSGFHPFGPAGAPYPEENRYRRSFLSLSAKIPIKRDTYFARVAGGLGQHVDELSAWKLGGNLVGFEPYVYPIHGYYTEEFLADEFGIVNLEWRREIKEEGRLESHVYADYAVVRVVPPGERGRSGWLGVGAGVSFRGPWRTLWLLSYGYGVNAARGGERGSHEVAIALEKSF